ncbi:hypothetical protein C8F04DRAFT_1243132 [Mycena alexandri]|uniref:Uncharacterized protein n=1 Tax=Mycena alexandri TaxID=1745969 RepID=A0AAD6RZV1_9AGAR|nr:hypothetical protein C8F04DRAFT_1243132 [Mycena alexandri]
MGVLIKLEVLAAQRLNADGWDMGGSAAPSPPKLSAHDVGLQSAAAGVRVPVYIVAPNFDACLQEAAPYIRVPLHPTPHTHIWRTPQHGSTAESRRLAVDRALYLTRSGNADCDVPSFAFTPRRPRRSFAGSAPRGRERGVWEAEGCVWQLPVRLGMGAEGWRANMQGRNLRERRNRARGRGPIDARSRQASSFPHPFPFVLCFTILLKRISLSSPSPEPSNDIPATMARSNSSPFSTPTSLLQRLRVLRRTSLADSSQLTDPFDRVLVALARRRYKREGKGGLYVKARVDEGIQVAYDAGQISLETYLDHLEVKMGHSYDVEIRRCQYKKCAKQQVLIWHYFFAADRRMLAERLVHLALDAIGAERGIRPCPGCKTRHVEYYKFRSIGSFERLNRIITSVLEHLGQTELKAIEKAGLTTDLLNINRVRREVPLALRRDISPGHGRGRRHDLDEIALEEAALHVTNLQISDARRERDAKEGEEREDGGNGDDERWGRKRREEGGVRYEEERAKGDKVESMSQRLADESAPHRTLHVKHLAPRLCRSRAVGGSEQEELRVCEADGGVEIEAWAPDKNIEDALAGVANADPGVEAEWTGMGVAATEMPEMSAWAVVKESQRVCEEGEQEERINMKERMREEKKASDTPEWEWKCLECTRVKEYGERGKPAEGKTILLHPHDPTPKRRPRNQSFHTGMEKKGGRQGERARIRRQGRPSVVSQRTKPPAYSPKAVEGPAPTPCSLLHDAPHPLVLPAHPAQTKKKEKRKKRRPETVQPRQSANLGTERGELRPTASTYEHAAREKAENPPHRRPTPTPRHTPPTPTPSARPIATREGRCGRGARGTGVGGGGCAGAGGRLEVVSREGDSLDNKGGKVREEGGRAGQRATLDGTHARSQPLSATIPRRPSESLHAHARDALDARAAEPAPKHDLYLPSSDPTSVVSSARTRTRRRRLRLLVRARAVDASPSRGRWMRPTSPPAHASAIHPPTSVCVSSSELTSAGAAAAPARPPTLLVRARAADASASGTQRFLSLSSGQAPTHNTIPRVPTPQPALPSPPQENEEARDSPPGTLFKTSSTTNSSTSAGTERALATRPGKPASSEYVRIVWCLGYSEVSKEDKISMRYFRDHGGRRRRDRRRRDTRKGEG